jgi:DNA-binding MarR family transcriptional regulator
MISTNLSTIHQDLEMLTAHVIQDFMRFMKQHGLSMPQIHALMYVYHAGECQVSDIGAMAGVSNAAASQLVERLVQQGLVDRKEDPGDRRTKIVRLSKTGSLLIHQSVNSSNFLAGLLGSLNAGQLETIHSAVSFMANAARNTKISHKGDPNGAD